MLAKVAQFVWGTPTRKAVAVLTGIFVLPAWVFNYENWLSTHGYDALLTDPKSPVLGLLGNILAFLTSTELRAAIIGAALALIADGLWRWKKGKGQPAVPEMSPDKTALINEHITNAYKSIGMALGAEQPLQYDLAMASIEPLLIDLSRRNDFPIPDLRSDGTEAGILRALCYLNALVPTFVLDDDAEARKRANEIVPRLDKKSADDLRAELGLSRSYASELPSSAAPMKAVTASSSVPPNQPQYEYPKAVLQIDDLAIARDALPDGQLVRVEGRLVVKSHCYMDLRECEVRVVSLGQSGIDTTIHGRLFSGRRPLDKREVGIFPLRVDGRVALPLITRDLQDTVSKPPFLLRLVDQKIPLTENTSYILTLDLRSEAKDITRARIQIDTQSGPNFSLSLLDQVVQPR